MIIHFPLIPFLFYKKAAATNVRLPAENRLFGPSDWFRTSGLVVPNHALYHLSYTRIFSFLLLPLWSKMWSNGDFRGFCGRDEAPKPQCLQGVAGFRISPSCRGCYTLPNHALYHLSYTRKFTFVSITDFCPVFKSFLPAPCTPCHKSSSLPCHYLPSFSLL